MNWPSNEPKRADPSALLDTLQAEGYAEVPPDLDDKEAVQRVIKIAQQECTHPRTWIGPPDFIARCVPGFFAEHKQPSSGQQWSVCQICGYAWLVQVWAPGAEPEAETEGERGRYAGRHRDYYHTRSRHGGAEGSSIKGEKL